MDWYLKTWRRGTKSISGGMDLPFWLPLGRLNGLTFSESCRNFACSSRLQPGGSKSLISGQIDNHFTNLGWREKSFDTKIVVDGVEHAAPTHKVDCFKNRVALEVEWNNKDPFFDRDLNNFRLLFELRAIDVGVIITRCSELQQIFAQLGRGPSYGNSTTHIAKLLPRLAGGGGGCPVVVFGIRKEAYVDDK